MSSRRFFAAAVMATVATIVAVAGAGCGWSARDAHMSDQKYTVPARPGDGSTNYSFVRPDPFQPTYDTSATRTIR